MYVHVYSYARDLLQFPKNAWRVAFGLDAPEGELNDIASDPNGDFVMETNDINDFRDNMEQLRTMICAHLSN